MHGLPLSHSASVLQNWGMKSESVHEPFGLHRVAYLSTYMALVSWQQTSPAGQSDASSHARVAGPQIVPRGTQLSDGGMSGSAESQHMFVASEHCAPLQVRAPGLGTPPSTHALRVQSQRPPEQEQVLQSTAFVSPGWHSEAGTVASTQAFSVQPRFLPSAEHEQVLHPSGAGNVWLGVHSRLAAVVATSPPHATKTRPTTVPTPRRK